MKKTIKILTLILYIFLNSCGFSPVYKSQNINFSIIEVKTNNYNSYFQKFKNMVRPYMQENKGLKNLVLVIDFSRDKNILSKDSKGNPKIYSIILKSNFSVYENENILINNKNITKSFKYNHKSDLFNLDLYEKNIDKNLINSILEDIILILSKDLAKNISKNSKNIKISMSGSAESGYSYSKN